MDDEKRLLLEENAALRDTVAGLEARLAGRALLESESNLRIILDSVYDAVFIHDLDGTIIDVNKQMLYMFRVTSEEAAGFSFKDDYSTPDNPIDSLTEIWQAVISGEDRLFEWRARRPGDGSVFDVEIYLSRIRLNNRDVILSTVRDISARKRAEKERSALLHMMTHDIKGPLTVIDGYCEMLMDEVTAPLPNNMIVEIRKASGRISSMIKDMLDLSAMECGKLELNNGPIVVPELIVQTIGDRYMPSQTHGIKIRFDVPPGLPVITGDGKQLGRAVENLVSNAVKFSRRGGEITVRTGVSPGDPTMVYIEVVDTGIGIADEDLPHVFEKYYRGKKTGAVIGSGLGLAIVKAVAMAHGGHVEVESVVGKGSTFRLVLPAEKSGAAGGSTGPIACAA